ncbi:hypothetical protein [Nocardiopsis flavescens]|nr:hypothetical protein [Nocardiopsis flavescens]
MPFPALRVRGRGTERGSAVPFIAGGGLVAALLIGGIVLLARRG